MPAVRLRLGPLPSVAVLTWTRNALSNLDVVSAAPESLPFAVSPDSIAPAVAFIEEWIAVAESAEDFEWEGEVDALLALNVVRYWHNIARAMLELARRGDIPLVDPVAEQFSEPLLRTLLEGLTHEQVLDPETAERMWDDWPRVGAGGG